MDRSQSVDALPHVADTSADAALREIEDRVLWLSTSIVHHANRVRPNLTGESPR
ncbi:hypothetical protein ACWDTP_38645 [Mycobacterium sp. NPDC003449]